MDSREFEKQNASASECGLKWADWEHIKNCPRCSQMHLGARAQPPKEPQLDMDYMEKYWQTT